MEAALLIGCETIPVDEQDYATDAEELADLLADNRLSELAELDEDDLRRVLKSIADSDPDFDIELTGFMEDEIRKLMDGAGNPEDEVESIPERTMSYHLNTTRGNSFPAVSSAMQKAVRAGDLSETKREDAKDAEKDAEWKIVGYGFPTHQIRPRGESK